MANYVIHYLYAQNLQQNLMDAGVLEKLPDRHRAGVCGYTHRILYAKCHADDWADCLKEILERGVIDCSKKNEDGSYELPSTITVLVNEKQAKLLAQYEGNADMQAALVYRGDKETANKFLAKQNDFFGGSVNE